MKTYDTFLFDADNTLFDYDRAEENALRTMFDSCGFEYCENIRTVYREINSKVWADYEEGKITKDVLQVLRFSRLFEKIGVKSDAKDFNNRYLFELGKGSFLIEGAFEICGEISSRSKKIYIVTNGILATQESRIRHSRIRDFIAGYFVSEFVGFNKPDPKYFEYVFSHIENPDRGKALIIGDSLTADIAGGINAGIDSCWFNSANADNMTGIRPTYTINRLDELKKFI